MGIKKIVRFSFFIIATLIVLTSAINMLVLYKVSDNANVRKYIDEIVLLQEHMNNLAKDAINATSHDLIDEIKQNFINDEKSFEEQKRLLLAHQENFSSFSPFGISKNEEIKSKLELLYANEKVIEVAFDRAYVLQEEKLFLQNKFESAYPIENKLRKNLRAEVTARKNIDLVQAMGDLEYYSKETLYQNKNKSTFDKWIDHINQVQSLDATLKNVTPYKQIVQEVGTDVLKIEELIQEQKQITDNIFAIITANNTANTAIGSIVEKIASEFVKFIFIFAFGVAFVSLVFVIFLAKKVNKNVGLSVDEVEQKVEEGIAQIKALDDEIVATQKEVIFRMGAIGEQRSKETGNHVKRVAEYSKLLALHYGLDEQDAEMIKQVSPMHDIGKVAIPDAILNKPGRFDAEERKIMDTHATLGYEMLKGSKTELLQKAAIVAGEHHERWDGSGYPAGKSGEDIHIFGRITAVADVFDALGSDRVYKKAWEDERIFELFRQERGRHFDPNLVDIFFGHLDEFLAIRDKFKDSFA